MPLFALQFVDSVSASATVRLDLNDLETWSVAAGTAFETPRLRRALFSTMLFDGVHVAASAYEPRRLTLVLQLSALSLDASATAIQALSRELDRPFNVLKYQPNTTQPVYFRLERSDYTTLTFNEASRQATVELLAEPFALGPQEVLPAITMSFDPAEGTTLNANPDFEATATPWTAVGGTVARSTAQALVGSASLLLTPDGVTAAARAVSEQVTAVAGNTYRASAWVRCAVTRSIDINLNWFTSGAVFISSNTLSTTVTANTWTFIDYSFAAPATAGRVAMQVSMTGTPPAGNTLHIDVARLRLAGGGSASYFDVSAVKGDVATPLILSIPALQPPAGGQWAFGTRRRGTPSNFVAYVQAEAAALQTDTAVLFDATLSGGSGARVSFATSAALATRLIGELGPAGLSDFRGRYRVYARLRKNTAADVVTARLLWGSGSNNLTGSTVTASASSSNLQIIDLGLFTNPYGADPIYDGYSRTELGLRSLFWTLQLGRTSGSGSVDVDYLMFMPADDQFSLISWGSGIPSGNFVWDGTQQMIYLNVSGAVSPKSPASIIGSGSLMVSPGATNRIYVVPEVTPTVAFIITDSQVITPAYYPRYLNVRPPTT